MGQKLTEAYRAIQAESKRVGWPKGYQSDLTVHDRGRLHCEGAPERFGWVLRKEGTLLLDATMCDQSRLGYVDHLKSSTGDRFYWWDGRALHACSDPDDLGGRMAEHATPDGSRNY